MQRFLAAVAVITAAGFLQAAYAAEGTPVADEIPTFKYDPDWPRQLPNAWMTGNIGAVYIDMNDHIWIAQRPGSTTGLSERYALNGSGECCAPAPPVLEFDTAGNLIQFWGPVHTRDDATKKQVLIGKQYPGPTYEDGVWPGSEHGIAGDAQGNIWVTGSGPSTLIKLAHDGKLLLRIGAEDAKSGVDKDKLAGPAGVTVDDKANEVYVSDGYVNRRVVVFDATTGKFKRHWGAYGKPPTDVQWKSAETGPDLKSQNQHLTVAHCVVISKDGLVYVCDRANSRVQLFQKSGKFVKELFIDPKATGFGTVYAMAFSADPEQKYLYVGNGSDRKIHILRRSDMKMLGSFGTGVREGGRFMLIHTMATDSKGNLYVGETIDNNRIQRFNFTGLKPVAAK